MVLSNKKLKHRIRSLLAESVAAAESRDVAGAEDAKQQLQGVKELLSSKRHRGDRPAGSGGKRKRKNKSSAEGPEAAEAGQEHQEEAGDVGGSVDSNNNNNNNNNNKKKKKKKGKREEGGGAGEGAAESNDQTHQKEKREEEEEGEKMMKKKKAKKKKRKKKKEGEGNEEVVKKNGNEAGGSSGGGNEMKATDAAAIDTSLENSDAMKKVYVGGIPYYSTEDDIRSFFESCGTITEVDCMAFPESGKFRGIAILTFKTEAAAKRAFALDGADMGGLYLKIQPYKAARTQKADFSPEVIDGYYRIYVGNLPWDITEDALRKLFLNCNISSIRFGEDKVTGEFKGYAHVDFEDGQSRAAALKLDQTVVCGRPVRIRCAVPKKGVETKQTPKPLASHGSSDGGRHASSVSAKGKSDTDGNASSGGAKKKKKRQTCYVCGVPGHLSSSCPQKKADGPASGSS